MTDEQRQRDEACICCGSLNLWQTPEISERWLNCNDCRARWNPALAYARREAVPEGWALVPREPTVEMIRAILAALSRPAPSGRWFDPALLPPPGRNGHFSHPDLSLLSEGSQEQFIDTLARIGWECTYVSGDEIVDEDTLEYSLIGWAPPAPEGDGWLLVSVFDTDDGPYAMFVRPMRPAPSAVAGGKLGCFDCGRPYGDEHGFPDLVVSDETWRAISPTGGSGGLLCPSCICKRAHEAGIEGAAVFRSGPFVERPAPSVPERMFPIQGGPAIPWSIIAPHERQAFENHNQTLERLAQRGGLGCSEAVAVLEDHRWWPMDYAQARARLIELTRHAPSVPDAWRLGMRVLQSDLYAALDDAERAFCDALVRQNPYAAPAKEPSESVNAELLAALREVERYALQCDVMMPSVVLPTVRVAIARAEAQGREEGR